MRGYDNEHESTSAGASWVGVWGSERVVWAVVMANYDEDECEAILLIPHFHYVACKKRESCGESKFEFWNFKIPLIKAAQSRVEWLDSIRFSPSAHFSSRERDRRIRNMKMIKVKLGDWQAREQIRCERGNMRRLEHTPNGLEMEKI